MLDLPSPPRYRMSAAPLAQALVQVKFPIVTRLQTLDGAAAIQAALEGRYPYLAQDVIQEMSLMVGPAGPAAPQTSQNVVHVLTSDDGWTVTLTVSSATLSVEEDYAGVDDFASRFTELCRALAATGDIGRCDRLGVRYLDVVEIDDADGWQDWFRTELVGVGAPGLSKGSLLSSITETRLRKQPDGPFQTLRSPVEGILRHGVVPAGSTLAGVPPRAVQQQTFVFDMDTFVAAPQPFDADTLADQFRALHAEIEKVFHWAVTDQGRARFGYEPIVEGDA
jgi:uncharacterized protein (TIGR04255 family)